MSYLLSILLVVYIFKYYSLKDDNEHLIRDKKTLENNEKSIATELTIAREITQKKDEIFLNLRKKEIELNLEKDVFEKILNIKAKEIPIITNIISDIRTSKYETIAEMLTMKNRPALKAAETVKSLKSNHRQTISELYNYKYIKTHYENLLPWITELLEEPIAKNLNVFNEEEYGDDSQNNDNAKYWLTKEEFLSLSHIEKYQLALDRYVNRKKSNQEIGRDYERYIGYCYEQEGFKVYYQGIIKGLEDLGRDLICSKDNCTHIVQCKCWSQNKTIHEKHINQLFGTTVMHYLTEINNKGNINDFYKMLNEKMLLPVFVTSTNFSDTAKLFSSSLGVKLIPNIKLGSYPLIKCNINKTTKEKIYHLPFDQQYDRTIIDGKYEFYANTIKEAENAGFRRAVRWLGSNQNT